jgi:hypothetical protein
MFAGIAEALGRLDGAAADDPAAKVPAESGMWLAALVPEE